MSKISELTYEGAETYNTPKSFLCDLCCGLVIRGQDAVLVIQSYYDEDPLYIIEEEDDDKNFVFVKLCKDCGSDHV